MRLQRLEATNFRNLTGTIEFSPGLNLIYGANAQGKKLLARSSLSPGYYEILPLVPPERGHHSQRRRGHSSGIGRARDLTKDLQLLVTESAKQTFVNGKREAVARYLGALNAIAFTADEMQVVRGAPARRRFLDRGIFFTLPSYLGTLNEYNRVLKQKNALCAPLQRLKTLKFDLIQPWNDQLVALGSEIHQARVNHVEQLRASEPRFISGRSDHHSL